MIYKAVNLHVWRVADSTLGLPGETEGGGEVAGLGGDVIYGDNDTFSS